MGIIQQISDAAGWAWAMMADHLWQSTILIAIAALACAAARRSPARIRYRIWLVAAAKLAMPSIALAILIAWARPVSTNPLPDSFGFSSAPEAVFQAATPLARLAESGSALPSFQNWIFISLSVAWLAGFAFTLVNWLWRRREFSRMIRAAVPAEDPCLIRALEGATMAVGARPKIKVVVSDRAAEPGVWGVWKPIVILPNRMAEELNEDELEAVLVHEIVHIQRRDNLVSNLTMMLYSLLWFFPPVWLIDKKLLLERELACDERALELGARPDTYASAILKVSRFSLNQRTAGVSCASASSLARRLKFIMSSSKEDSVVVPSRLLITAVIGASFIVMVTTALMGRTRASGQTVEQRIVAALTPDAQHGGASDAVRRSSRRGVPGGVDGGVAGGIPGGVPGGVPGGIPGGVPGGIPGGVPGGVAGGVPGGVPGGVGSDEPGPAEGAVTDGGTEGKEASPSNSAAPAQTSTDSQSFTGSLRLTNVTAELPISAQNVDGGPVSITGASISTLRFELLKPAPATPEEAIHYRISLTVRLLNNTGRIVTGVALRATGLMQIGKARVVNCFDSIAAGSLFTFSGLIGDGQVSAEDATSVRIKIVGVRFEDGTAWGSHPPGPYPPRTAPDGNPILKADSVPQSPPTGNPPDPAGAPASSAPSQPQGPPPASATPALSPSDLPKIIRKSGGVLQSSAINRVLPQYPKEAKAAGISGGVAVEVVIDEDGNVEKATAISGPDPLRDAAVEAARQWRWNPTTLSGVPVKVIGTLAFGFAL